MSEASGTGVSIFGFHSVPSGWRDRLTVLEFISDRVDEYRCHKISQYRKLKRLLWNTAQHSFVFKS